MQPSSPRYAIYFTPQSSMPLARFGASVLGYDVSEGRDVPHLALKGIFPTDIAAATAAPRKYGFHATLAAPFYLGDGHAEADLLRALDAFSHKAAPAGLGRLQVSLLGGFIALTPEMAPAVGDLASTCVTFFDAFRAPPSPYDLARRDHGHLTQRQRDNLARWGYPYVFEDFRFHMTLAGSLGADERDRFLAALAEAFMPVADQSCAVDAVSLMRQADTHSRFEVIARKDLKG